MNITFSNNLSDFFADPAGQKTKQHLINSLAVLLTNHDKKIKPIYLDTGFKHLYEMKIKKAGKYYRMAFYYDQDQVICFYLDQQLIKHKFEANLAKYLRQLQL